MHLTIKNLGRLESASINLDKPLTVFVGRNNTSKTYVAYTVYALRRYAFMGLLKSAERLVRIALNGPTGMAQREFDAVQLIELNLDRLLSDLGAFLRAKLPDALAADQAFCQTTSIALDLPKEKTAELIRELERSAVRLSFVGSLVFSKPAGSRVARIQQNSGTTPGSLGAEDDMIVMGATAFVIRCLDDFIFSKILAHGSSGAFALPTERTAIQLFYRELLAKRSEVVDAVRDKPPAEAMAEIEQETRFYPLAIRDGLTEANHAARRKNTESPLAPIADKLDSMLGGAIGVDELGDLVFQPTGRNEPLGLQLASSSVKSLAGLSFYLRHMAQPGRFLLIDEPELSLHPDNQRKVTRIIAEIVNAGVRVLITTHSDYILRELGNLILLKRPDASELRKKHGYGESELLSPESVGVYLFDETTARPLEIGDNGIDVQTIDDEINELNQISRDIYFKLIHKPDQA